jgi:ABC-type multidrug transport system fused ATPase/permease subunit
MKYLFKDKIWFSFSAKHRYKFLLLIVAGFAANYITLLLPLSIGKFLQLVSAGGDGKAKALRLLGINLPDSITVFFSFFMLLLVLKFFITWAYNFRLALFGELFVTSLRSRLFSYHLQQAVQKKQSPSVLMAYGNEAKSLQRLLTKGVIGFIKDVLFILLALYLLFAISMTLSVVVLLLSVLFFIIYRLLARRQKSSTAKKNKLHASLLKYILETVVSSGKNTNTIAATVFQKKVLAYCEASKKWQLRQSLLNASAPLLFYVMLAVVMLFTISFSSSTFKEEGDVVTYILLLLSVSPVLRNIIKIQSTWIRGKLAAKRYSKVQDGFKMADSGYPVQETPIALNSETSNLESIINPYKAL